MSLGTRLWCGGLGGRLHARNCTLRLRSLKIDTHSLDFENVQCNLANVALFPVPRPAFCHLQYGEAGRAWYISSRE